MFKLLLNIFKPKCNVRRIQRRAMEIEGLDHTVWQRLAESTGRWIMHSNDDESAERAARHMCISFKERVVFEH